jgi:hypothetical protein
MWWVCLLHKLLRAEMITKLTRVRRLGEAVVNQVDAPAVGGVEAVEAAHVGGLWRVVGSGAGG